MTSQILNSCSKFYCFKLATLGDVELELICKTLCSTFYKIQENVFGTSKKCNKRICLKKTGDEPVSALSEPTCTLENTPLSRNSHSPKISSKIYKIFSPELTSCHVFDRISSCNCFSNAHSKCSAPAYVTQSNL